MKYIEQEYQIEFRDGGVEKDVSDRLFSLLLRVTSFRQHPGSSENRSFRDKT
jgi:hypothetical protein